MQKYTLFFTLFSLGITTSTAFAEEQPDDVKIEYSVEYRVDGVKSAPVRRATTEEYVPIYFKPRSDKDSVEQEKEKIIGFNVIPQMTEKGLHIGGSFIGHQGEADESVRIYQTVKSGEESVFSFEMNGKVHEIVLNVEY